MGASATISPRITLSFTADEIRSRAEKPSHFPFCYGPGDSVGCFRAILAQGLDMILEIPDRPFGGYIFDCDGTLVDSMPLHFRAWTASFRHHGAPWDWSEDDFYANAGVPDRITVMELNAAYGTNLCPDEIHHYKAQWYGEHIHELQAVPAVAQYARDLFAAGAKISVASGSDLSLVQPSLEQAGLADLFSIVITPADVLRGKPAPDMFLLAAERMGVPHRECLVFEDGAAGIAAADAAGMASVFVESRVK